jgi:MFS transporter, DHA1 family, tetracycline resistance protein
MATLFFIVFLDLVGFGMIIPVFPFYAEHLGISPSLVIFFFGLYSFGQLFGAPLWGALSDRMGRRPILLATLAANTGANLLLAFASTTWELAISRLISGLAAGNISIAYAYLADITSDAERPKALGLLGAAFGLGFILGPALGGALGGGDAESANISRVAMAAAVMSALAFVATYARLRESHGPEHRAVSAAQPRGIQWRLLERPALRQLLGVTLIVVGAVSMLQGTFSLWAAQDLGVSPRHLGFVFAFIGVLAVAVQAGLIGRLTARFGPERLTRTGTLLVAVSLVFIPLSPTVWIALVPMAFYGIGTALFTPSVSNLITRTAGPSERGAVLGLFQGVSSLGRVIGPVSASALTAFAGLRLPFWVAAGVSLGGAFLVRPPARATETSSTEALRDPPVAPAGAAAVVVASGPPGAVASPGASPDAELAAHPLVAPTPLD